MSTNSRPPYSFYAGDDFKCVSFANDFDPLAQMVAVMQGDRVVMCVDMQHLRLISKEIDKYLVRFDMPMTKEVFAEMIGVEVKK